MGLDKRSAARWLVGAAAAAGAALATTVAPAAADATYRTERLALVALGGAPLRAGAVVNAHANGPRIYAHEQYTLVGAQPRTDYQVVLLVDLDSAACATAPELRVPTAVLTTNAAGTGTASAVFTPADAAGLRGLTVGGRWQVTLKDSNDVLYQTACTAITLD
jgi:hypothetical protein